VFLEPNSILLLTKRIVNEDVERRVDMQMMKKGEQLFKNVKDFTVL
jgi:hypothetical protein